MRFARTAAGSSGFTLVELLVALQLIAALGAMIVPEVAEERKRANEGAAVETLRTIERAQEVFLASDPDGDGVTDYARSLAELTEAGLLYGLGSGVKQGYNFSITRVDNPNPGWFGFAIPQFSLTGGRAFRIDQTTAIVSAVCPPGYVAVWTPGGVVCRRRTESSSRGRAESVDALQISLGAAGGVNALGGGAVLPLAKSTGLPGPAAAALLARIDADMSGRLSLDEVLTADLLAAVRLATRAAGGPGPSIGPDAELDRLLRAYQGALAVALALRTNENAPPEIDLNCLSGYPAAFLELVMPPPSQQAR